MATCRQMLTVALAIALPVGSLFAQAKPAGKTSQEAFKVAQALYSDGDWVKALAAFQQFETQHRFSSAVPESIYYQGWCWANQGRWQESINVFQRLITGYKNNILIPESLLKQAECYRELKDYKKSIELCQTFQRTYPKHEMLPQALLGEASAQFKSGNIPAAKTTIQTVQQRFANNQSVLLDSWFLLGQILTEEKDYKAANKLYRLITAQRSNPRATEALYLAAEAMFSRGETLQKEHKPDDAEQCFRDAIGYYKGVRSKPELMAVTQREIDNWEAQHVRMTTEGAEGTWETRYAALKRLRAQINDRPDLHVLALFRIANCYQSLDMPDQASVVYQFLVEHYPDDKAAEQVFFGWIQTLTQRGQLDKAKIETANFKQKFPKSLLLNNAAIIGAEALFGKGEYVEALAEYEKALPAAKDEQLIETIEFRIATCQLNLSLFDKARDGFAAFAQTHPKSSSRDDALFLLARARYEIANHTTDQKVAQTNLEDGIKAYQEILTKYPASDKLPKVTFQLGYLYSYLGGYDKTAYDKAIATFQSFITKWPANPDVPEAMYQIARNHLSAQRYPEAIAAYKTMYEKFPDHALAPYAALEAGTTFASMKQPAEMIEALRYYTQHYPNHPKVGDALYAIAAELEAQKRVDEAIPAYRAIIERALAEGALSDDTRNSAIAAQIRISDLLARQNIETKAIVADCEQVLGKFAEDPIAARAMVNQIATIYRTARLPADGAAKLEALSQQYSVNTAIRHAAVAGLIELAVGEKDYAKANASVTRLLADPDKAKLPGATFLIMGSVLLKTDKYQEAKENYERVLAGNDPQLTALANLGLGQALLGLHQLDAAKAPLENAASAPGGPRMDANLGLGKISMAKGTGKPLTDPANVAAVKLLSDVLQNAKQGSEASTEAAYNLGNIFFNAVSANAAEMKDNKKLALAYYSRLFFATGPMAEEGAFRAAECHEALGNTPLACSAFQAYTKRFPTGRFVTQARTKVTKLCAPKPE